ncbi:D-Ala-D-Ala carboxypeptidase family metallohydrolase [Thermosynechococcaceae cyanobacterium BACA0444]|uniref:D-Ala-D-Ala carboxypeptidase family metallohydrolase n=1 Tax=Pseudocalidococcus azoricus BACA0444 TaxID=2918990 RepID=A0AAE4FU66_9CYAN|nr:D-Ala-D-Ala carboxypeptidase family metallohydrolase [Pseudocalidococcus azoricus]MDS3861036.1 D-Ala-D-Ala carboxypeptidase family metallohydrolase [Pseudocalidococcus azoricus BACA0444]
MSVIDWNNPNSRVSKYFTVGEVTNNQPARIPPVGPHRDNVIRLARELDLVREAWGGPIGVTSWYRPPAINRAVGGVSNSQHLTGLAADIYPIGRNGREFEAWLDRIWVYALGYGQSSGRGFTHVDLRPGRARWRY